MCKSDNDTQLMHLIDTWKMALADENTTAVTKATLHAVLYVADEIMHERAVKHYCSNESYVACSAICG